MVTWPVYTGVAWTGVFAIMTFYWAAGGTFGVESLGGKLS